MANRGEQGNYEIKPEERQLMIEAGVQFYLNSKKGVGKDWKPSLFFEDKRFLALPQEVQEAIKSEIAKKDVAALETGPGFREKKIEKLTGMIAQTNDLEKLEGIAQSLENWQAYAEAAKARYALFKKKRTKALLFKVVTLLSLSGDTTAAEQFISQLRTDHIKKSWIEEVEQVIRRAKRKSTAGITPAWSSEQGPEQEEIADDVIVETVPLEEEPVRAPEEVEEFTPELLDETVSESLKYHDIDPEQSVENVVEVRTEKVREIINALKKQAEAADSIEIERLLSESLDSMVAFIDEHLLPYRAIQTLDTGISWYLHTNGIDAGKYPRLQFWKDYLATLTPALKGLRNAAFAEIESIRLHLEARLQEPTRTPTRKEKREAKKRPKEEGLKAEIRNYGLDPEKTKEEMLQDWAKHFADFQAKMAAIEKILPNAVVAECERILGLTPGIKGDITQARAWIDGIKRTALENLTLRARGFKPSVTLPEDRLAHWQDFLNTLLNQANIYAQETNILTEKIEMAVRARLEQAQFTEVETQWQNVELPARVEKYKELVIQLAGKRKDELKAQGREIRDEAGFDLREALELTARRAVRGLLGDTPELRFDPKDFSTALRRFQEEWRVVIEHFFKGLKNPYTVQEINDAEALVQKERAELGDKFAYSRRWRSAFQEKNQGLTTATLLSGTNLKPDSLEAIQLLELLDWLEALERIPQMRRVGRALEQFAYAARRDIQEARRQAERAKPGGAETVAERQERANYIHRAEFYALATAWHKGKREEVKAYFQATNMETRQQILRELYLWALQERGVVIPGAPFRNLATGLATPVDWDHFVVDEGGKNPFHRYGYVQAETDTELVIQEYDRYSMRRKGERRLPKDKIRGYQIPRGSSLDGRMALELLKYTFEKNGLSKDQLDDHFDITGRRRRNVHYILAGKSLPGVVVNTGGRERDQFNPDAEEMFADYLEARKKGEVTGSGFGRVDIARLTEFLDHHAPESQKESAGVKVLYEKLKALGCFEKVPKEELAALETAIQFVVWDDNKSHPEWLKERGWWEEKWTEDAPYTMLGLAKQLTMDQLMRFYKKYDGETNPETRRLTPEELAEFGLTASSKAQARMIQDSQAQLAAFEAGGFVLRDTQYGIVVIRVPVAEQKGGKWRPRMSELAGGIDAIRAKYGKDSALLIWNPLQGLGKFFFSTAGREIVSMLPAERLKIEPDRRKEKVLETQRGTMLHGHRLYVTLSEFIDGFLERPEAPLEIKSDSRFATYLDGTESPQSESWQRAAFTIERIDDKGVIRERLPQLFAPVPLEKTAEGYVRIPSAWSGYRNIVIEQPENPALSAEVSPDKHYNLKVLRMIVDRKTGRTTYYAEVLGEEPYSPEAVDLEEVLSARLKEHFRTQGYSEEDLVQLPRREVALLYAQAWERMKSKEII